MPIIVYSDDPDRRRIAEIGSEQMLLVELIPALDAWLAENGDRIRPGCYVADVGYEPRENATGGGPVLSPEMMRKMADLGIALYLSEYNNPDPDA